MFTEARKIQLLEEILKTDNEATLVEVETVLKKNKNKGGKRKKNSIRDFMGVITEEEASEMTKAIEETCEKIYSDDWK